MLRRIRPHQAAMGMYVHGFEGSWLSHPFWRARFVIASDAELLRVRNSGTDIVIDTSQGVAPAEQLLPSESAVIARMMPTSAPRASAAARPARPRPGQTAIPTARPRRVVAPPTFGKADKARAITLAQRSTQVVRELFDDCRLGRSVSMPHILQVVDEIADTLEQNSAAFASVTRLKAKDDYTYTHSVAVCALMISLARETGAAPEAVQALGIAGLLHDIGKLSIDAALLGKTGALSEAERAEIMRHPELGHALLSAEPSLPTVALDVCLHHHERLDGSGYPFGLSGDGISPATRMAAICDVYDAMTSDRPYKKGMTPVEAIAQMETAVGHFDAAMMFRFMRSIGIFPAGKLLRLRSNRLAVVLPSTAENRRPIVRAFYATVGAQFIDYDDTILSDSLNDDQAVAAEHPDVWFCGDWPAMAARIMAGKPLAGSMADEAREPSSLPPVSSPSPAPPVSPAARS